MIVFVLLFIVLCHCVIGLFTWSEDIKKNGISRAEKIRNRYAAVSIATLGVLSASLIKPVFLAFGVFILGWFIYTAQFLIALRGLQSFLFWLKNWYKLLMFLFWLALPNITQAVRFI